MFIYHVPLNEKINLYRGTGPSENINLAVLPALIIFALVKLVETEN